MTYTTRRLSEPLPFTGTTRLHILYYGEKDLIKWSGVEWVFAENGAAVKDWGEVELLEENKSTGARNITRLGI